MQIAGVSALAGLRLGPPLAGLPPWSLLRIRDALLLLYGSASGRHFGKIAYVERADGEKRWQGRTYLKTHHCPMPTYREAIASLPVTLLDPGSRLVFVEPSAVTEAFTPRAIFKALVEGDLSPRIRHLQELATAAGLDPRTDVGLTGSAVFGVDDAGDLDVVIRGEGRRRIAPYLAEHAMTMSEADARASLAKYRRSGLDERQCRALLRNRTTKATIDGHLYSFFFDEPGQEEMEILAVADDVGGSALLVEDRFAAAMPRRYDLDSANASCVVGWRMKDHSLANPGDTISFVGTSVQARIGGGRPAHCILLLKNDEHWLGLG